VDVSVNVPSIGCTGGGNVIEGTFYNPTDTYQPEENINGTPNSDTINGCGGVSFSAIIGAVR
jgi:hypothetical protein